MEMESYARKKNVWLWIWAHSGGNSAGALRRGKKSSGLWCRCSPELRSPFANARIHLTPSILFLAFLLPLSFMQAQTRATVHPEVEPFIHPGVLLDRADLKRMKANLAVDPWKTAFELFAAKSTASLDYMMRGPFKEVGGKPDLHRFEYIDDMSAVQDQAVMWYLTGNAAHAEKAMRILEAWAGTHRKWSGETWGGLLRGDFGLRAIVGAEILRATYPDWTREVDQTVRQYVDEMLSWKSGPSFSDPATDEIGTGNQGAAQLKAIMAAAIYLDDEKQFDYVVRAVRENKCASLARNSRPSGQNAESGRDQGHALGGIGGFMAIANLASKQGVDLFGDLDNRMLGEMEYWSKYNLGHEVPYEPFGPCRNWWDKISPQGRYEQDPVGYLDQIDRSYGVARHLPTPYCAQLRSFYMPTESTLFLCDRPVPERPEASGRVITAAGDGVVAVSWFPALGAESYTIKRATGASGSFEAVAEEIHGQIFLDRTVKNGTEYRYVVCGDGKGGEGEPSAAVTVSVGTPPLLDVNIGGDGAAKSSCKDGVWTLAGWGGDVGRSGDSAHFSGCRIDGDGMITAKLASGTRAKAGVMMRSNFEPGSPMIALMVEGSGIRLARRVRGSFFWTNIPGSSPHKWLRLGRVGYSIIASYSEDGVTWKHIGAFQISGMMGTLETGLFAVKDQTVTFGEVGIIGASTSQ